MIVRQLDDIENSDRSVKGETWESRRLLLAGDGMGFSLHDTILYAGTATKMWYKNHVEAVYCIEGRGRIEDLETGVVHPIEVGTVYALDQHDRHILYADETLRMVCVFNPPLKGKEVHDASGAYPTDAEAITGDAPPKPAR